MTISINAKEFGLTSSNETIELTITQDAYVSHNDSQPHNTEYVGTAEDRDGNEYLVVWHLQDDFDPRTNDDESIACDWDNPWSVTLND
jgi:hypothetical protein